MKKFKVPGKPPVSIERRNAWFHKLTPAQQMVAIAQDVIEQLRLKKFVAESGEYFRVDPANDEADVYDTRFDTKGAQELVCNKDVACAVCARGGLFASRVRLGNDAQNPDYENNQFCIEEKKVVGPIFGDIHNIMEFLFENGSQHNYDQYAYDNATYDKLHRWIDTHNCKSDAQRMTLLMRNLIKNEGDLVVYGHRFTA